MERIIEINDKYIDVEKIFCITEITCGLLSNYGYVFYVKSSGSETSFYNKEKHEVEQIRNDLLKKWQDYYNMKMYS